MLTYFQNGAKLAGAPQDVGTYTVVATYAGNGNYTAASATAAFAITPAALTIAADADPTTADVQEAFSQVYGSPLTISDPGAAVRYTGFDVS